MFDQPGEGAPQGVVAKFESECPQCDGSILPGEPIYLTEDREWICQECNDAATR